MAVRRMLHARAYRYRLHAETLPGCPDRCISRTKRKPSSFTGVSGTVHGCPVCDFAKVQLRLLDRKQTRNAARDKTARSGPEAVGVESADDWECQIKNAKKHSIVACCGFYRMDNMPETADMVRVFCRRPGMARLGLGQAVDCAFANERCSKKTAAYRAHFKPCDDLRGRCRNLTTRDLPGVPDLVWASFPCQDLSPLEWALAGG